MKAEPTCSELLDDAKHHLDKLTSQNAAYRLRNRVGLSASDIVRARAAISVKLNVGLRLSEAEMEVYKSLIGLGATAQPPSGPKYEKQEPVPSGLNRKQRKKLLAKKLKNG